MVVNMPVEAVEILYIVLLTLILIGVWTTAAMLKRIAIALQGEPIDDLEEIKNHVIGKPTVQDDKPEAMNEDEIKELFG